MTQATKQDWLDFLATRQLSGDGQDFGEPGAELVAARDATIVVPLVDQDLIRASGEDAHVFLHNLLTNDVENLPADGVRFAGFCTAKGRLLATFTFGTTGRTCCWPCRPTFSRPFSRNSRCSSCAARSS